MTVVSIRAYGFGSRQRLRGTRQVIRLRHSSYAQLGGGLLSGHNSGLLGAATDALG